MLLHLSPTPMRWMRTWLQQLRVQGFVLFSCLGPDSLRELRQVHSRMAWPEPAHAFTDMHDWGDMLVQVGFAEPVMDMERLTLTYPHAEAMLQDLRDMGRNLAQDRWGRVQGRAARRRWIEAVEAHGPRDGQGRLTLTFELIYGHAAKAPPRLSVGPTTAVPLQAMRDMLRPTQRPQ
jgi:malonyl-CoA O-methyltransferase